MKSTHVRKPLKGSVHKIPKEHKLLKLTSPREMITVTLIIRRRKGGPKLRAVSDFSARVKAVRQPVDRTQFIANHGADPKEVEQAAACARANGLEVVETNLGARSVVVRGTAARLNKMFDVKLCDYQGPLAKYHSHVGPTKVPGEIATIVEAVIGLHSRPIHAKRTTPRAGAVLRIHPIPSPSRRSRLPSCTRFRPATARGRPSESMRWRSRTPPANWRTPATRRKTWPAR